MIVRVKQRMQRHVKMAARFLRDARTLFAFVLCSLAITPTAFGQSWIPAELFDGFNPWKGCWSTDGHLHIIAGKSGADRLSRLYDVPAESPLPQLVWENDSSVANKSGSVFISLYNANIATLTTDGLRITDRSGQQTKLTCVDSNQTVTDMRTTSSGIQVFGYSRLAVRDSTSWVEFIAHKIDAVHCDTVYRIMPHKRYGQPVALGHDQEGDISVIGYGTVIRPTGAPFLRTPYGIEIGNLTQNWKANHDLRFLEQRGTSAYIFLERRTRDFPYVLVHVDENWNVVDTLSLESTRETLVNVRSGGRYLTVTYDTSVTVVDLELMQIAARFTSTALLPFMTTLTTIPFIGDADMWNGRLSVFTA